MMFSPPRTRIFLVDRAFQLKYTWAAVGIGLLSTMLTCLVILYPLYVFGILRIPRFLPWPILCAMGVAVLINIGGIAMMGVLITHRIAGPVFGLIRHMRRIAQGKWIGNLKVRQHDELQPLVRNLNEVVEALARKATQDLEAVRQIIGVLEALEVAQKANASALSPELAGLGRALAAARELDMDCRRRLGEAEIQPQFSLHPNAGETRRID